MAVVGKTSSPEGFEDFARNVLERFSMRQIDQKLINILTILLVSLPTEICPYKEKQTQPDFYRGMPQASHRNSLDSVNLRLHDSTDNFDLLNLKYLVQSNLSVTVPEFDRVSTGVARYCIFFL